MSRPRLSIPTRISLSFALVLAAFAGVGVYSLGQHARTVRTLELLNEGLLPLALTLGEAKATQAVFATLLNQIDAEDAASRQGWLSAARAVRPATLRRAFHGLERAEYLAGAMGGVEQLASVRDAMNQVESTYRASDADYAALEAARDAGDVERAERMLSSMRLRERDVQRHYRDGWRELQEAVASTSSLAAEEERRASIVLGALVALSLSLGLFVGLWSRRILKPIPALHRRVEAVARGDLSTTLDLESDDELGRLAAAFDRMVQALSRRDASLRELQRMQLEIVEGLRSAVIVVGADDVLRLANPAACEMFGTAPDHPLDEAPSLATVPGLRESIRAVRERDERVGLSRVVATRDGEPATFDLQLAPFGGRDEEPGGAVLIVVDDVSDEVATAARLIHTERLAAIGRMAAHVTHEVRNPLSSIGLNVELLEEELTGGETSEAADLIRAVQREVERLRAITDQYLRLSRVPRPSLEPHDLAGLLSDLVRFLAEEMRAHGVSVRLDVAPELPLVFVDAGQLRQALLNLLRNAREAMPEGGVIDVVLQRTGRSVTLTIRDHGSGVSDLDREHIFDLFFTTKERGTGLGLPLTQQIIAAHGGQIACVSPSDGGTAFEIVLPVRAPTPEEPPDEPA